MNLKKAFEKNFERIIDKFQVEENFNRVNIEIQYNNPLEIDEIFLKNICEYTTTEDDKVMFNISINDNDEIVYQDDVQNFIDEIKTCSEIEGIVEKLEVNIHIDKLEKDNIKNIYDLEALGTYLNNLNLKEIIFNFYELSNNNIKYLKIREYEEFYSCSNLFNFMGSNNELCQVICKEIGHNKRKEVCNFLNGKEYQFYPENFNFNKNISKTIDEIVNKLKIIYSLISIFNISQISDNKIELTLNGYKRFNININFREIDIKNMSIYYDIYVWIYENGTVSDKIELARNIISLYLDSSNSIKIDQGVLEAIKSNYNIYIKDNVEKYFEIKSKVIQEILIMTEEISEVANHISQGIKTNLKAIGTFIITAIIMNSLSDKKLENIFTRDITAISIGLCLISFICLGFAVNEAKERKKEIITKYYRLKFSYNDILVKKDIENIFRKDKILKKDIKKLNKKIKHYVIIWAFIIIIYMAVVLILNNWHNIEKVFINL